MEAIGKGELKLESIFRKDLFKNHTALITGGGSGIGFRTAKELASLGAHVILASRNTKKLHEACEEIKNNAGEASYIPLNIRDEASIKECFSFIKNNFDKLNFLINNAGGQFPSPAEKITSKGWNAVIETNLTGSFMMCCESFQSFFKENGGKIVNVLANFWNGFPMMSHTGAARAGVENLTKTLATEWGRYGVSINSVAPGIINSSGLDTYDPKFKSIVNSAGKFNQTSRLGTEAEVANTIIFLLGPVANYITGETIKVDGGESLFHPLYPPIEHSNSRPDLY